MNNICVVSEAYMCSNCGACSAVCPTDAINFKSTNIGRMYADVDLRKCIACGLCRKVCPSLDIQCTHNRYSDKYMGKVNEVFVGRCSDEDLFINSQSGGACSAVIKHLFTNKKINAAIVCQMTFGNPPEIKARIITDIEDILQTQKSCYTPVDMLSILKQVSNYDKIAVVGLPCHIQGIESMMSLNRFKNIKYRLGLICDRTLCGTIQEVFGAMGEMFPRYKIAWRHKLLFYNNLCLPYKTAPVSVSSIDGRIKVFPNTYRFLLKETFTPPRCRVCYDKLNVFADIVFGDPWRMTDVNEERGSSLVITRTEKGSDLINEMISKGELILTPRPIEQLYNGQLIDSRRKQMAIYSQVINNMPYKIDSYLYHQEESISISDKDIAYAQKKIDEFIKMEKLPKTTIIKLAHRHILIESWIKKLHVRGIMRRIKEIFH